jgi:predicted ribosome quality control (RQC) complex YloA/Tae2 family protein
MCSSCDNWLYTDRIGKVGEFCLCGCKYRLPAGKGGGGGGSKGNKGGKGENAYSKGWHWPKPGEDRKDDGQYVSDILEKLKAILSEHGSTGELGLKLDKAMEKLVKEKEEAAKPSGPQMWFEAQKEQRAAQRQLDSLRSSVRLKQQYKASLEKKLQEETESLAEAQKNLEAAELRFQQAEEKMKEVSKKDSGAIEAGGAGNPDGVEVDEEKELAEIAQKMDETEVELKRKLAGVAEDKAKTEVRRNVLDEAKKRRHAASIASAAAEAVLSGAALAPSPSTVLTVSSGV